MALGLVLVLVISHLAVASICIAFGRIRGEEEERERAGRVIGLYAKEAATQLARHRLLLAQVNEIRRRQWVDIEDQEVTRRQCRSCLKDATVCRCPMASREGSA